MLLASVFSARPSFKYRRRTPLRRTSRTLKMLLQSDAPKITCAFLVYLFHFRAAQHVCVLMCVLKRALYCTRQAHMVCFRYTKHPSISYSWCTFSTSDAARCESTFATLHGEPIVHAVRRVDQHFNYDHLCNIDPPVVFLPRRKHHESST